jgi:hypothetical protein
VNASSLLLRRERNGPPRQPFQRSMNSKSPIYSNPSDVQAVDGAVQLDGPDAVDVAMTPEAAEETSERLAGEALKARGQRRLGRIIHRPQD